MRKCFILIFVCSVFQIQAQDTGKWSRLQDMSVRRLSPGLAAVNGKLYAVGGEGIPIKTEEPDYLDMVEEYDPASNKWATKSKMPLPLSCFITASINNKIYIIGGQTTSFKDTNLVLEYDPVTDNWNQKSPTPKKFFLSGSVVFHNNIYIGDGNHLYLYNPSADKWDSTELNITIPGAACLAVVNNKLWSISGGDWGSEKTDILEYNESDKTWKKITDVPKARSEHSVVIMNEKLYLLGGCNSADLLLQSMDLYNVGDNEWIKQPDMPAKLHFPGVVSLNQKIYIAGGAFGLYRFSGHQKTLYEYTPPKTKHPYASDEPMPEPKIFEIPGVANPWNITFEPDGHTFYFLADSSGMEVVKYCHYQNGVWSYPRLALFSGKYRIETPSISPDGSKFFFTYAESNKENIYIMTRSDSGWYNPVDIGMVINSPYFDASPNASLNGNLYFGSGRSGRFQYYCSRLVNGTYSSPEKLDNTINQYYLLEFFIAPDESYILFGRYLSESNYSDIYISFKNDSRWTTPKNLGPKINKSSYDGRPYISPDGNYLFYTCNSSIYQVDWKPMLDSLRKVSFPTGVENNASNSLQKFVLHQNYPNPFNPETVINYDLPVSGYVDLKVFDVLGREVSTLINQVQEAGNYSIKLDAGKLTSGIYFYQLTSENYKEVRKMICLK